MLQTGGGGNDIEIGHTRANIGSLNSLKNQTRSSITISSSFCTCASFQHMSGVAR
jgi:hypothetical protein